MRQPALLALFVCSVLASPAGRADDTKTRQQIDALNTKISQLKDDIKDTQGDRSRAAKKLQHIETEIGTLAATLRKTEQQLAQQERKLQTLRSRQTELQAQQQRQKNRIAEQVREAYTLNQETPLKMLLNQQSPDTLTRNLTYYEYFNQARGEKLAQYRDTLQELESLVPAIVSEQDALLETRETLEQQRNAMAKQQRERKEQIAKLDKELSRQQGSLKSMADERKALEQVLQRLDEDINVADIAIPASNEPFAKMRGKLRWPVPGKHLNRYGASRQGSAVTWQGVQIAGREGEAVRAIHNGRVVFADWLRGTGLLIILDHGGGYLSLYGHNQSLLRQEGDWVKGGDAIATLGNSGGKRQAGLYFEIRQKGRPINPSPWCR
ncbi:peptidoglycan DD-metalloendopeptidase family protein [Spongiibacter taiwanensis]|uniref:murein hydrolase activator EnvC family protein n=1 Tax=Spongiibacter taiwanensis TaxID=1748242 RepID=UPI0020356501|nr:peptidoglycan DD-metalloendopeptidase family protein [Spongiibacter taiwanensis]USA44716.1 peptidoglycan DD-metalloendopeptidase family protein [Spongiibacter taiwanensis]